MNGRGKRDPIKTKRLILRQFTESDADNLYQLDNDPEVMRHLNGGTPVSREVIINKILPLFLRYDDQHPGFGFWAVEHKDRGHFLGWISFRPTENAPSEAALGFRFCKAAWGRGYATEGARAVINKGFTEMGVQRVVATTYQDNLASQRVMEKLGMTLVRRFRMAPDLLEQTDTFHLDSSAVWDGDDLEYALDRPAWKMIRANPMIQIRPLEETDKPAWLRLRLGLWDDPLEVHEAEMAEILDNFETSPVWVAVRPEGGLCGLLECSIRQAAEGCVTDKIGYLEGWYVDEDIRRQGIGGRLVAAAEAWAVEQGCTEMASDTTPQYPLSPQAHARLGYKEVQRTIHFRKLLTRND